MRTIQVGLLGCGTVGRGVVTLFQQHQELICSRVGALLALKKIADIDDGAGTRLGLDPGVFTTDARQVVDDPEIDIVLEMIGGDKAAKELMLRAIDNGKQVVTANKALLARHGREIFAAAMIKGVDLAFEASVGGCMPIIKTLRESLAGDRIYSMTGILNGTCNYILTKMTDEGTGFDAALKEAQVNGFAEADPTLDIQGFDTAHKLAILSALAYGMEIDFGHIFVEGITRITPLDVMLAREFGYRIKLLAISKFSDGEVECRVHPAMIPEKNILSSVNGSLNAVAVHGAAVGHMLLYGRGAGMMPTAAAVIGDTVDLARNLLCGTRGRIPVLGFQKDNLRPIPVKSIDAVETQYYIRFPAMDRPGVLSKISGSLGNYGISIRSVHQKGRHLSASVPIVMLTHKAREADIHKALAEIRTLNVITDQPVLIRLDHDDRED